MDNGLVFSLYRDQLLSLRCQRNKQGLIIAKPLIVISLFHLIGADINENIFPVQKIKEEYQQLQAQYNVQTPYQYPLYFLGNESFFHLKWAKERIITKAPSDKLVRENIRYAFLDNALWDILQEKSTRDMYEKAILEYYLSK